MTSPTRFQERIADPSSPAKASRYAIRYRSRRGYSREAGGYTAWNEYQVVDGRKVVARFDVRSQAQEWIEKANEETGGGE